MPLRTRSTRFALLLVSFLIAFAMLAIGRAALSAPDADVDLAITKSASANPVIAGNPLTYSLRITNLGPSLATGVTVTDSLPAGVTFTAASVGCSYDNTSGRVRCSLGEVGVGSVVTPTVAVRVNPSSQGSLRNNALIGSGDIDINSANNQTVLTTTVTTSADLVVSVLESSDPLIAGGYITYTVSITNSGPSDASNVILDNNYQPSITYVSASVLCDHHGHFLTCNLGVIPANNRVNVLLTFRTDPGRTQDLTNTATVSASTADPNLVNNSDTDLTTMTASADVAVTKTASANALARGAVFSYTLTISNRGLSNAQAVSLSDTLPVQVIYQSYTSTRGACSGTLTITCSPGLMAPGELVTIVLTGMVAPSSPPGSFTNTASVTTTTSDPVVGNNSASATITVVENFADLLVTKRDSADPLQAGQLLTYTIGITNTGTSDASGVVVTDTLPSCVSLISATPSQGTCTGAICALGWVSATHTASVTLVVGVSTALGGVISNTVAVSANESDPVPLNNHATEQTTIIPLANLSLEKTRSPEPVHAGELLNYRLTVTNLGPSLAGNVHLIDDLPPEVVFLSAQPACLYALGDVDCALGNLAPNATTPVTITVRVSLSAIGTITNTATVSSSNAVDLLPANNQARIGSTLLPPDTELPLVSWVSPVSDEGQINVGCQIVRLEVNATDNVAVHRVRFYRWDHIIDNYIDISYDYTAPYQWDFDTCSLPPAVNQVFAAAQDTSGNPANWSNRKRILLYRNYLQFFPAVLRN